ncbi:BnaA04g16050D [Brassica napus]|uniref:BnaA04g16050D protein n=1 Tax=Brassica napus TaxID=3708 RepID=A0A078H185_BRANA|nr:BnaA04g16050D [Brassica napus]
MYFQDPTVGFSYGITI